MTDDDARDLLRRLDDPVHWEFPPAFDCCAAIARLTRVKETLDRRFGCSCRLNFDYQDASCHGDVCFPPEMLTGPQACAPIHPSSNRSLPPQLRTSNFGDLAVVVHEDALHDDARTAVLDALARERYIVVRLPLLVEPYTGALRDRNGVRIADQDGLTWFYRFFDYM